MITLELSNTETPGEPTEDSALLSALDIAITRLKTQQYLDADYMQQQVLKAHQTILERLRDRLYRARFMATPELPPSPLPPPEPDLPVAELVKRIRELDETLAVTDSLIPRLSLQSRRNSYKEALDRQRKKN